MTGRPVIGIMTAYVEPASWALWRGGRAVSSRRSRTGPRFRVGVQWHPEVGADPRLIEPLVVAATAGWLPLVDVVRASQPLLRN